MTLCAGAHIEDASAPDLIDALEPRLDSPR